MSAVVEKTLHELGNGLFDVKLTKEMLDVMKRAAPAARRIDTVVHTHGNGDH